MPASGRIISKPSWSGRWRRLMRRRGGLTTRFQRRKKPVRWRRKTGKPICYRKTRNCCYYIKITSRIVTAKSRVRRPLENPRHPRHLRVCIPSELSLFDYFRLIPYKSAGFHCFTPSEPARIDRAPVRMVLAPVRIDLAPVRIDLAPNWNARPPDWIAHAPD